MSIPIQVECSIWIQHLRMQSDRVAQGIHEGGDTSIALMDTLHQ